MRSLVDIFKKIVLFFVTFDKSIPTEVAYHKTYLVFALVLLISPLLLSYAPGHQQESLFLFGLRLPPTCASRAVFDVECPGCGLTRSFVALTHGYLRQSLMLHRVGLALYLFFLLQVPLRIWFIVRPGVVTKRWVQSFVHYLGWLLILLLMANWLLGLLVLDGNGS